jgi:hypothetical protein
MLKPLPTLGCDLAAAGYAAPQYAAVWASVARGGVPQIVRQRGRLYYNDEDLDSIARTLGVERVQPATTAVAAEA